MNEFFYHKPYGKAKLFKEKVDKADSEKLAKLVKIVGLLLQTKVYLFWKIPEHFIQDLFLKHYANRLRKLHS